MAKPICVIKLPSNLYRDKPLTGMECNRISEQFKETKPDYYWFVLPSSEISEPEFQVSYEKDFTEIQYDELKKLITDSIK